MPRRTPLGLCIACLVALAAGGPLAAVGSGESVNFTPPGTHSFLVPIGVTSLHVVAVGGRGGGGVGGYGGIVSGDVAVRARQRLTVSVAANGGIGSTSVLGGGGPTPLTSLAGAGGGSSRVTCRPISLCSDIPLAVAAGGGGSGAAALPGLAGAGGNAGVAGSPAETVAGIAGGAGGQAAGDSAIGAGGEGGLAPEPFCDDGDPGSPGNGGIGGRGGASAALAGFGDGGGGGGGRFGGGGGGAGGYCNDVDEGLGGGGGGCGSSLVPAGGTFAVDTTGVPSVTISWTPPPPRPRGPRVPSVTIEVPADGGVYERGQLIPVAYRCEQGTASTAVVGCKGTRANGRPLGTAHVGQHTFKVVARTRTGVRTEQLVEYTVDDTQPPAIVRLRVVPRVIDLNQPRSWARVRFGLSERALVRVTLQRLGSASSARSRTRVGKLGTNGFRLRARSDRRTLRAGSYELTLIAIDDLGNRSRPARRRFTVVG